MADVFPQVNTRSKDREDLDDDIDYVGYRYACVRGRELNSNSIRKCLVSKQSYYFPMIHILLPEMCISITKTVCNCI